tara:strand:- start:315 stop:572 length:258 start_codon:yes stop_codon:yes gene_type:complete
MAGKISYDEYKTVGDINLYVLVHWPESQIYMDTDKYPNVEYVLNDEAEPAGSLFVPITDLQLENKWKLYHAFAEKFKTIEKNERE